MRIIIRTTHLQLSTIRFLEDPSVFTPIFKVITTVSSVLIPINTQLNNPVIKQTTIIRFKKVTKVCIYLMS